MKGIKSAMSIVAVRDDPLFPEDVLESGRKWMGSSEVEHEVKVFGGRAAWVCGVRVITRIKTYKRSRKRRLSR